MNKFIVVKARNPELYAQALHKLRSRALGLLPFNANRVRVKEFKESLVFFANFELSHSAGFEKHYVWTSEKGMFAFDGLPYQAGLKPGLNWAQHFDVLWTDDDHLIESVFGTWAFARFDSLEGGRAVTDFTGMTPLFYWASSDYVALSPRQMLLSGVCGELEQDVEAMAWLTGQANIMGDALPWKGVRHLPPQWTFRFNSRPGDVSYELDERRIWTPELNVAFDDARISDIHASLMAQCDALGCLPMQPFDLDITGGLDSRLVAALATTSSLKDRVRQLRTAGPEGSYEIQVGRAVADLLGLPHQQVTPAKSHFSPEKILTNIRRSAFRYEGSITPSDGAVASSVNSGIRLTGSAGEIYRRHCKPHMSVELSSVDELKSLFADYHQKTDPLGIQRDEVTQRQKAQMQQTAVQWNADGVELNDVTDVFFMRFRLPLWNGIMMNNISSLTRVYPLVNFMAAKYAFSRGFKARVHDRVHFELMLKISPELCAFPFLKYVWPQEYRSYAKAKGVEIATSPFEVQGSNSLAQHGNHFSAMMDEGWELSRQYLMDDTGSDLWGVLDRKKVEAMFAKGGKGLGLTHAKQIFSMLGMQASLSGDTLRDPDGRPAPPKLDGVVAQQLWGSIADGAGR